jgi:hypothetical protein
MANMQTWLNAKDGKHRDPPRTTDVYTAIRNEGLETVIWEEFSNPIQSLDLISEFVHNYKPCLFIYDPLVPHQKKGYLFNVTNIEGIKEWIGANPTEDFSYLITSMIDVKDRGCLGSVYTDGKGNMIGETAHIGESNHRKLSQSDKVNAENSCQFTVDAFVLSTMRGSMLKDPTLFQIMDVYADKEGFFEFVHGEQAGKWGIYTTGFERGPFPYELKEVIEQDLSRRIQAIPYR